MNLIQNFQKQSRAMFIIWFLFTLVLFLMPWSGQEVGFTLMDKIIHFGLFFLLFIFAFLSFKTAWYKVFLWLLFYVVIIEFIQEFFIPGRGYQPGDLLAGFLGLLVGCLLFKYQYANFRNRNLLR